jgi:two-component sensor histidine kinase
MARGLIIVTLLATALLPCRAQQKQFKPIDEVRTALNKSTTDTGKANQLLDLALCYVYKAGELANDLDSAVLLVRQAEGINAHLHDKKIEAKCYFVFSNALRERGKTETSKQYIEKSLEVYKTISDPSNMAEAWAERAIYYNIYDSLEEIKQKRNCLQEALILFKAADNKERQADMLKDLGDLDEIFGDATQAMKELNEALNIYVSIGHKKLQGVYDLMGFVCGKKGDLPDAVKYGLLAVKTAEEEKDTSIQLCTIYQRLGMAYAYWGKYDEGLPYSKKALSIAIKYRDRWATCATVEIACRLQSALGREADALESIHQAESIFRKPLEPFDSIEFNLCHLFTYVDAQKYDKAKSYAGQIEAARKRFPGPMLPLSIYHYLVKYYLGIHQYENAKKVLSEYFAILIPMHEKRVLAKAYKLNSQLDSARGDFRSALSNYQLYQSTNDSMLNEATTFKFAQIEVEHETEKKDNDIKLLKQDDEIHKSQLIKTRLTNSIIIAGVIVLILLLALLYARYRTNQRHNRQLETKRQQINEKNIALEHLITDKDNLIADKDVLLKEKDWLVKEIHHRVKNNLQMVISLLNAQSEFLNNPSALDAIRESRERMQAIAIIHQKLYQVDNSTQINMRTYINELVDNIKSSLPNSGRIHFQVDVANVGLDISQSVPLGLILNEAITNAIKYAYPPKEKGDIRISLQFTGAHQLQLKIADYGKGLPAGMDTDYSDSLGLQLIKLFAEQLEADLYFINNNGLEIILNLKIAGYKNVFTDKVTSITA